jgi:divalent metal cation (Fe/Co/Zn/Cd) transporter
MKNINWLAFIDALLLAFILAFIGLTNLGELINKINYLPSNNLYGFWIANFTTIVLFWVISLNLKIIKDD